MPTNYQESAFRHLRDADYLWNDARHANASQLYGMGAECALKAVMIGLGVSTLPDGSVQRRIHFPNLWNEFMLFASGRLGGKYAAAIQPSSTALTPFSTWDVAHRYSPDSWLTTQLTEFLLHQNDARDCLALLELAKGDGVVV